MAYTFTAGKVCPVYWTPYGGSAYELVVTDHGWQEQCDKIDITHTGSGGIQALLAGIFRGTGNVKAFQDTGGATMVQLYAGTTRLIRAGQRGTLKHYITAAIFFLIPGLITQVNNRAPVAGGVEYDFNVELDSESGTLTYPVQA